MTLFGLDRPAPTSDDYYTPRWVFDAMGIDFDLDVAAPPGGVEWVPAARHFTMADDGLSQPWVGRVWMNPPYGNVDPWWDRFAAHGQGVALLPTAKSLWFDRVWRDADAVVVPQGGGEMFFVKPGRDKPLRIWFPVILAAFGDECIEAIARLGVVRRAA